MTISVLGPIADPHCARLSGEPLVFKVDGDTWEANWGRYDAFGTPAYWVDQTVRHGYGERVMTDTLRSDLVAETVFCLLGGFGVTAEAARDAHAAVRPLVDRLIPPTASELEAVLAEPLPTTGRRYRFPRQRAARIAAAVGDLRRTVPPSDAFALRDYLLTLHGVGPKTAAWIVRNVTGDDRMVIVDIWLQRSLTAAGVFLPAWNPARHYSRFEEAFLQYASYGAVSPAGLDLCIWEQARTFSPTAPLPPTSPSD